MTKKVAVVDDDRAYLEELSIMLSESGYEVYPFDNGSSALNDIPKVLPDLVLLDLKMDRVSGFQVADRLRCSATTRHIPLIAMTGHYTQLEYDIVIKTCGMRSCVLKPFSADKLLQEIETAIKDGAAKE